MNIATINIGTKTKDIPSKRFIATGYAGRRLYWTPGTYHDMLVIARHGKVIEVIASLPAQDQRIHQGW